MPVRGQCSSFGGNVQAGAACLERVNGEDEELFQLAEPYHRYCEVFYDA
jgi:hypothetical protein